MSANTPIRVGIIGAGAVASRIHIPGLMKCPSVEVAAVADPNIEAARATGVDRIETDYHAILHDESISAVVVAAPNFLHREIVLHAAKAGKHMLCEKPLGLNVAEVEEMVAATEAAGVRHMTAFTYAFTPAARYLKHLMEKNVFGEVRVVRGAYQMALSGHTLGWRSQAKLAGSGVLGDVGSHLIYLLQAMAGDISALCARNRVFRDDPTSDVEDYASFLMDFTNGASGVVDCSRFSPGRGADISEHMYIEIYGTHGGAVFDLQDPLGLRIIRGARADDAAKLLERTEVPAEFHKLPGAPREIGEGEARWSYRFDQAYAFAELLHGRDLGVPTFVDGLRCQRVLDAELESAAAKTWVTIG